MSILKEMAMIMVASIGVDLRIIIMSECNKRIVL